VRRKRGAINEETIREQLRRAVAELERVEQDREALVTLIHGFETWLQWHAQQEAAGQPAPGGEGVGDG
jgi:hypothetical protein